MTLLVANEVTYKFLCDSELKAAVDAVFERQGTSLTEGTARLLRFFVEQPSEVQAAILGQVKLPAEMLTIALNNVPEYPSRFKRGGSEGGSPPIGVIGGRSTTAKGSHNSGSSRRLPPEQGGVERSKER